MTQTSNIVGNGYTISVTGEVDKNMQTVIIEARGKMMFRAVTDYEFGTMGPNIAVSAMTANVMETASWFAGQGPTTECGRMVVDMVKKGRSGRKVRTPEIGIRMSLRVWANTSKRGERTRETLWGAYCMEKVSASGMTVHVMESLKTEYLNSGVGNGLAGQNIQEFGRTIILDMASLKRSSVSNLANHGVTIAGRKYGWRAAMQGPENI